jgi:unsaturated rhamnogalacturonyl hydrolase
MAQAVNKIIVNKPFPFFRWVISSLAIAFCFCLSCQSGSAWSVRMAKSEMARHSQPWLLEPADKPVWEYTHGLLLKSIFDLWSVTGDSSYIRYVESYYNRVIDLTGEIASYKQEDYILDRINPGKTLFNLYRLTGEEKYLKALQLLREQMKTQPRTGEGGFWHKKIYPDQMWLDGIYMASPFLAEYAQVFHEPTLLDDVANQIELMEKHAKDPKTGLLYHGWDESRKQRWADPETGLSSQFWGRSMGWYDMAVVDALDFFPENHPRRSDLISLFVRLNEAVAKVQDPQSGTWFQVLDQGGRKGNYLESSASGMFVYAMAKGIRKGYLPTSFIETVRKGYQGILDRFITVNDHGFVDIHQACAVAGLGGNPYRDGSYEYYVHEPIKTNDIKAVGSFILASLEVEALQK